VTIADLGKFLSEHLVIWKKIKIWKFPVKLFRFGFTANGSNSRSFFGQICQTQAINFQHFLAAKIHRRRKAGGGGEHVCGKCQRRGLGTGRDGQLELVQEKRQMNKEKMKGIMLISGSQLCWFWQFLCFTLRWAAFSCPSWSLGAFSPHFIGLSLQ
jgi:hypothetical protein